MVIEIASADDPRVAIFSRLTEAQLRQCTEAEQGLFIAESPKVIRVALAAGYEPHALLCERRHLTGDAADVVARMADVPVFTGEREVLAQLTGYVLTRGVLCAMRRTWPKSAEEVCRGAHRVAVLCNVVEATNVGAIFRSAAALGVDAVLLTPDACDPLNRRAVRVSMGTVFQVPWARIDMPLSRLHDWGLVTVAMALRQDALPPDAPQLVKADRLALILGTEGEGLPDAVVREADHVMCIPMAHGVDSLNVAAASAVAFWTLRPKPRVMEQ